MSKLTVAGIGPGEADYILPAVIEKMKKAHTGRYSRQCLQDAPRLGAIGITRRRYDETVTPLPIGSGSCGNAAPQRRSPRHKPRERQGWGRSH